MMISCTSALTKNFMTMGMYCADKGYCSQDKNAIILFLKSPESANKIGQDGTQVLTLLIHAGVPTGDSHLNLCTDPNQWKCLQYAPCRPLTLQRLGSICVRDALTGDDHSCKSILRKIDRLPLPSLVKQYMSFDPVPKKDFSHWDTQPLPCTESDENSHVTLTNAYTAAQSRCQDCLVTLNSEQLYLCDISHVLVCQRCTVPVANFTHDMSCTEMTLSNEACIGCCRNLIMVFCDQCCRPCCSSLCYKCKSDSVFCQRCMYSNDGRSLLMFRWRQVMIPNVMEINHLPL